MKTYYLVNRTNPNDKIVLKNRDLTPEQMREIARDGYEIVAIQ